MQQKRKTYQFFWWLQTERTNRYGHSENFQRVTKPFEQLILIFFILDIHDYWLTIFGDIQQTFHDLSIYSFLWDFQTWKNKNK